MLYVAPREGKQVALADKNRWLAFRCGVKFEVKTKQLADALYTVKLRPYVVAKESNRFHVRW